MRVYSLFNKLARPRLGPCRPPSGRSPGRGGLRGPAGPGRGQPLVGRGHSVWQVELGPSCQRRQRRRGGTSRPETDQRAKFWRRLVYLRCQNRMENMRPGSSFFIVFLATEVSSCFPGRPDYMTGMWLLQLQRSLDYVSREDILPYTSTDQVPIQHELFERFLLYDQTKAPPFVAQETLRAWQEKNHPWLELSDVHRETTENIRVTVIPFYMGMREAQNSHVYWWHYCIRLENLDSDVVQLRERHWRIFSLSGTLETMRGRGVVGREPVLSKEQPAFQFSSHVSLQASSGYMWGTFRFERPDGSHFDVRIPPFSLESNKDEKTPPSGLHW
uniref:Polymerase delta-interacting protein 2 n=2 Tax=Canis lupus familiaris TaxID=9615 RepID=A0A8C0SII4_CANLF